MSITYRQDIDGLRGLAILAVLGFHYFPRLVPSGFVGVDIFFVISGYLITGIIIKEHRDAGFAFSNFYARRVRRIFPALAITLLVTYVAGLLLMLPGEFKVLNENIAAASAFVLNFLLIRNEGFGYFNANSATNPLLHLWSLSIEEQFYIVWPLLIWGLLRKRKIQWLYPIAAALLCLDLFRIFDAAFDRYYFPGTRFWELAVGGCLAVWTSSAGSVQISSSESGGQNRKTSLLVVLAFAAVIYSIFCGHVSNKWPGPRALIPVLGAACLIGFAKHNHLIEKALASKVLVLLGLISFPLYLYHWLFLSFFELAASGAPETGTKALFLLLAISLAYLTYQYVETPIRRQLPTHLSVKALCLITLTIAGGSVYTLINRGFEGRYAQEVLFNDMPEELNFIKSDERCRKIFGQLFSPRFLPERDFCLMNGKAGERGILIVGDSHASKLYQSLLTMGVTVTHLGRGSCPPLLIFDPNDPWYGCQPTLDTLIGHALTSKYDLLIFAGVFERYFDQTYQSKGNTLENVEKFFQALGRSGKDIVIVLDNPELPFDPKVCLKRPWMGRQNSDCSFDRETFERKTGVYRALFRQHAKAYPNVRLVDAADMFCNERKCFAINSEGLLYTGDNNHLSMRGARLVNGEIVRLFPDRHWFPSDPRASR